MWTQIVCTRGWVLNHHLLLLIRLFYQNFVRINKYIQGAQHWTRPGNVRSLKAARVPGIPGRTGDVPGQWGHSWAAWVPGEVFVAQRHHTCSSWPGPGADSHLELAITGSFPYSSCMGKLIQGEAPATHLLRCFYCSATERHTSRATRATGTTPCPDEWQKWVSQE